MVRMNITMPERGARKLSKFKNKSRFIAEAVEEKIAIQEKERTEQLLQESYKKAAKEDGRREDPEFLPRDEVHGQICTGRARKLSSISWSFGCVEITVGLC